MKVLMINGSPHPDGNTALALKEMENVFHKNGIETKMITIGNKDIRSCIACQYCATHGKCVFNDIVNETAPEFEQAAGLVIGSPVYYANPNAALSAFLQRLFYSTPFDKTMKVGASIAAARRGGLTAVYDDLNKYFGISGMPIASGQYWNGIHGLLPGQADQDEEGKQQMRTLAANMAFLMKSIDLGLNQYGLPEKEKRISTHFIR